MTLDLNASVGIANIYFQITVFMKLSGAPVSICLHDRHVVFQRQSRDHYVAMGWGLVHWNAPYLGLERIKYLREQKNGKAVFNTLANCIFILPNVLAKVKQIINKFQKG